MCSRWTDSLSQPPTHDVFSGQTRTSDCPQRAQGLGLAFLNETRSHSLAPSNDRVVADSHHKHSRFRTPTTPTGPVGACNSELTAHQPATGRLQFRTPTAPNQKGGASNLEQPPFGIVSAQGGAYNLSCPLATRLRFGINRTKTIRQSRQK